MHTLAARVEQLFHFPVDKAAFWTNKENGFVTDAPRAWVGHAWVGDQAAPLCEQRG